MVFKNIAELDLTSAVKNSPLSPAANGTFEDSDDVGLRLDDKLTAVYDGKKLCFKSYFQANKIFDLSGCLTAATDPTVRSFLTLSCISDGGKPQEIVDSLKKSHRKLIAQIMSLGQVQNLSAIQLSNKAKQLKSPINIKIVNNKIEIPKKSSERTQLFQFLANRILKSHIDDKDYQVSSSRPME